MTIQIKSTAHKILVEAILSKGKKKGLDIRKNIFTGGWTITLPGGGWHNAKSDSELINYVRGY